MAYNADRFVIVDGVQMSRARAERLGLTPDKKKASRGGTPDGPPNSRARTSDSARKGSKSADAGKASGSAADDTSGGDAGSGDAGKTGE